ncbi:MAG: FtsQ-type POTRA domain-containing protein [Solirubrobacteraceae bacterium]|jgi:cell division protein FtsQ|nr:FtsQ-type POTRA domain-containing protein [Solirubrobacteraceae bacterium]
MQVRLALPQPRAARLPRLPRPSWRLLLALAAIGGLLAAGWMWLRDSSLVQVEKVTITGANGFGSAAVRSALEAQARDMTTLNVDEDALRAAVARYPLVEDVSATPDVPHGLRIVVRERTPVAAIVAPSGAAVAVADDGTLLRSVPVAGLPEIPVRVPPGGASAGDRRTAVKVELLAAAPARMRGRVTRVTLGPQGLTARLDRGPVLRFGDGSRLEAKWIAAARVLRDPGAANASYLDLSVPERPVAGGLTPEQGGAPAGAASTLDPTAIAAEDPGTPAPPANPTVEADPAAVTPDPTTAAPVPDPSTGATLP